MVLKIERFQPEGMNVRMSGGKPSYSHVVRVSGSDKIVYTAGQLARDVDGDCVGNRNVCCSGTNQGTVRIAAPLPTRPGYWHSVDS